MLRKQRDVIQFQLKRKRSYKGNNWKHYEINDVYGNIWNYLT